MVHLFGFIIQELVVKFCSFFMNNLYGALFS